MVPLQTGAENRRIVLDSIDISHIKSAAAASGSVPVTPTGTSNNVSIGTGGTFHLPRPDVLASEPQQTTPTVRMMMEPPIQHRMSYEDLHQRKHIPPPISSILPMSEAKGYTPPMTPYLDSNEQSSSETSLHAISRKSGKDPGIRSDVPAVDKLIEGIWRQIHDLKTLDLGTSIPKIIEELVDPLASLVNPTAPVDKSMFSNASIRCLQVTSSTRSIRPVEVLAQTYWVDLFDARLAAIRQEYPNLKQQEHKKLVMTEACNSFAWAEKELRNRMAIWKGYREIRDAAGWSALIFAGPGIYRYCKYRSGFDQRALSKLRSIRSRAELAADTLQPQWRELLSLVHEPIIIKWTGHPHDWTVSKLENEEPLPLAPTYFKWDPDFSYTQIRESIIDTTKWPTDTPFPDPRRCDDGPDFYCRSCGNLQSSEIELNACECFPDLYSPKPWRPCPVQIFRTNNGKNNGLTACCTFEPGQAIGEFAGMITRGLANIDVMQSQAGDHEPYQIWQGRCGNFTRFINHSCAANSAFHTFSWLGIQRIVVVSKGVQADEEITVDYSDQYWDNLDKICLCGTSACRYKERRRSVVQV